MTMNPVGGPVQSTNQPGESEKRIEEQLTIGDLCDRHLGQRIAFQADDDIVTATLLSVHHGWVWNSRKSYVSFRVGTINMSMSLLTAVPVRLVGGGL